MSAEEYFINNGKGKKRPQQHIIGELGVRY
jgi:hypothetical protein